MDGPRIERETEFGLPETNLRNGEGLLETQVRCLKVFRFRAKAKNESAAWLPLHRSHCQQNWDTEQTAAANRQTRERRLCIREDSECNILQMKITHKEILCNGNAHTHMERRCYRRFAY